MKEADLYVGEVLDIIAQHYGGERQGTPYSDCVAYLFLVSEWKNYLRFTNDLADIGFRVLAEAITVSDYGVETVDAVVAIVGEA